MEFDKNKPLLAKYGKIGHTFVLYLLSGILVYLPMGFICHLYLFKDDKTEIKINEVTFGSLHPLRDWYIILGAYFAAPLVYLIFHFIYYNVNID